MDSGGSALEVALDASLIGERLDRALAARADGLSRERIKALLEAGRIRTRDGGALSSPSWRVPSALTVRIDLPPATDSTAQAEDIPLSIAFEDAHLIVVDKPAGLVVHPAAGNTAGTLVNALLHHCRGQLSGIGGVARPGIVHRIDKDTSGLIVAAKTDAAHAGLARQFAAHSIDRRYLAIVAGHPLPASGTVRGNIGRSATDRKKMAVVAEDRGKAAVTHFITRERLRGAALVECRLETGRTHQVRVHMAHIGHPLLGDPLYARRRGAIGTVLRELGFGRQALHAAHLGFIHPETGEKIALTSAFPADMQELLSCLRV